MFGVYYTTFYFLLSCYAFSKEFCPTIKVKLEGGVQHFYNVDNQREKSHVNKGWHLCTWLLLFFKRQYWSRKLGKFGSAIYIIKIIN